MSTLLLHFHEPRTPAGHEQTVVIAQLQTLAQLALRFDLIQSDSPEAANAYDTVVVEIEMEMKRLIGNATQDRDALHHLNSYQLAQLIYLLSGRNAEFE